MLILVWVDPVPFTFCEIFPIIDLLWLLHLLTVMTTCHPHHPKMKRKLTKKFESTRSGMPTTTMIKHRLKMRTLRRRVCIWLWLEMWLSTRKCRPMWPALRCHQVHRPACLLAPHRVCLPWWSDRHWWEVFHQAWLLGCYHLDLHEVVRPACRPYLPWAYRQLCELYHPRFQSVCHLDHQVTQCLISAAFHLCLCFFCFLFVAVIRNQE